MKKDKNKCKNKGESTIGKIIYGFLLFMPLLAILSTILYTTFNKNAYQSFANNNESQYQVIQVNQLVVNEQYHFNNNNYTPPSSAYAGNLMMTNFEFLKCINSTKKTRCTQ